MRNYSFYYNGGDAVSSEFSKMKTMVEQLKGFIKIETGQVDCTSIVPVLLPGLVKVSVRGGKHAAQGSQKNGTSGMDIFFEDAFTDKKRQTDGCEFIWVCFTNG